MDKLDLDKPLECEHGEVKALPDTTDPIIVKCKGVMWDINEDGSHVDGFMPQVRNAKRKPEKGEWWMVKSSVGVRAAMLSTGLKKAAWTASENGSGEVFQGDEFEPLYPMIQDPSYKEQE